jgi:hypothetical protein
MILGGKQFPLTSSSERMDFIPQNPRDYDSDSSDDLNLSLSDSSSDDEFRFSERQLPAYRPEVQDPYAFDSDSDSSSDDEFRFSERQLPAYRPGVQDPYAFDSDSDSDRGPALFDDDSSDDDLIPRLADFANLPVDFFLRKHDFYHESPFYDSDSSDDNGLIRF